MVRTIVGFVAVGGGGFVVVVDLGVRVAWCVFLGVGRARGVGLLALRPRRIGIGWSRRPRGLRFVFLWVVY